MAAVAHNPEFARKVGIKQSVGREFNQADAGSGILKRARRVKRTTGNKLLDLAD
jgi:hypothetical protein